MTERNSVEDLCPLCKGFGMTNGKKIQIQYAVALRLFFEKYPDGNCPELKLLEENKDD